MQEKRRFEDSWRDAFDGAEMTPPEHVWVNVELDLAGEESRKMKKRVIFYQRIAAGLLIVSASLGVYVWNSTNQNQTVAEVKQQTPENKNNTTEQTTQKQQGDLKATTSDANVLASSKPFDPKSPATPSGRQTSSSAGRQATTFEALTDAGHVVALNDSSYDAALTELENTGESSSSSQLAQLQSDVHVSNETDSVTEMSTEEALRIVQAYLNPVEEKPQVKKKPTEMLWLAMGGGAGSYSPRSGGSTTNGTYANPGALLDKTSLANSQAGVPSETSQHSTGSAYSVGVSVGTKVGQRWIVQSGLNYIHQQIDYTSNVRAITSNNQSRLVTAEYLNAESTNAVESLTATSPYTINSAMEFVSIPVQAGYLIIDRRVAWQVNTGVSTDIFMRNTLVDESGRIEKFSQSAGNESPYRTINWSGLFNTEVSYRLSKNYRVAVVPGMRYSITSILKDAVSTPLILDIGFRFRYVFVD